MHQPSVLIIDDSEMERYMLNHQLKKIGVSQVIQKNDGTSGLEFLQDYLWLSFLCQQYPLDRIRINGSFVNPVIYNGFKFYQISSFTTGI